MLYPLLTLGLGVKYRARRPIRRVSDLKRTTPMTMEIIYLTAQIQRWLNLRVARHLEAQAAKFTH
jgi:hypothetical protein